MMLLLCWIVAYGLAFLIWPTVTPWVLGVHVVVLIWAYAKEHRAIAHHERYQREWAERARRR